MRVFIDFWTCFPFARVVKCYPSPTSHQLRSQQSVFLEFLTWLSVNKWKLDGAIRIWNSFTVIAKFLVSITKTSKAQRTWTNLTVTLTKPNTPSAHLILSVSVRDSMNWSKLFLWQKTGFKFSKFHISLRKMAVKVERCTVEIVLAQLEQSYATLNGVGWILPKFRCFCSDRLVEAFQLVRMEFCIQKIAKSFSSLSRATLTRSDSGARWKIKYVRLWSPWCRRCWRTTNSWIFSRDEWIEILSWAECANIEREKRVS